MTVDALLLVVGDERRGLRVVGYQARLERIDVVVIALHERLARNLRRRRRGWTRRRPDRRGRRQDLR